MEIRGNEEGEADSYPGEGSVAISLAELSSLSSNLSYFYLKNELGLSEEVMWKITYDAGSVLGMTAATIRRKVEVLQSLMNLTDDELRTIIQRQPTILQLSADKNLSPTILDLLRYLDLGRDELKSLILGFPGILTYSKSNRRSKIRFFTRILGFSTEETRKIFLKEPMLFRTGVHTGLFPRMRFLLKDIQIPMEDLRHIVMRHPRILLYSLEDNLIPKLVYYCLLTIRMEPPHVVRLLRSYPDFMGYNLDRQILPITRYFLQDLDYSVNEFQKILLNYPRLVTNSITKIKHFVGYLRFESGLCAAQVRRVLYQAPSLLGLETDGSVRNKVSFIREQLGLDDEEWKRMLTGIPNVLLLSIDNNIKPKLSYLMEAFEYDQVALREAILRLPTMLGYSLEKRIIPRMEAILEAGIDDPGSITIGIPMKEDRFNTWLEGRRKKLISKEDRIYDSDDPSAVSEESGNVGKDELGGTADASDRVIHWTRERRLKH